MTSTDQLRDAVTSRADSAFRTVDLDGLVASAARRGRRHRRARVAGGLVVAAVVAAGASVVVPSMLPGQDVAPALVPAPKLGFPGVQSGGLLMDASTGVGTTSVTVPAPKTALGFDVACPGIEAGTGGQAPEVRVAFAGPGASSNAAAFYGTTCTGTSGGLAVLGAGWDDVAAVRDDLGADPSDQITATATVQGQAIPVSLGVYRVVSLQDYPVPAAPDPLPPLDTVAVTDATGAVGEPVLDLDARWQGPTVSTSEVTLPPGDELSVMVLSQTPAEVTVRVDGSDVVRQTIYDYDQTVAVTTVTNPAPEGGPRRVDIVLTGGGQVQSGQVQVAIAAGGGSVEWERQSRQ
jgi:hypothetical protein